MIVRLLVIFVFFALPAVPNSESGQQGAPASVTDHHIASLAGFDGVVGVIVEELDSEVVKNGLSKGDVRTEIEVSLYKHGLLKRDWKSLDDPLLHVQVGTHEIGNVRAFTIRLELLQNMRVGRPMPKSSSRLYVPETILIATWSHTVIGATRASDVSAIRDALRDVTTKFITDFRTANDKQR